jgi:hypothetical protein
LSRADRRLGTGREGDVGLRGARLRPKGGAGGEQTEQQQKAHAARYVPGEMAARRDSNGARAAHHRSSRSRVACERFDAETAHADSTDLGNIAALLALASGSSKSRNWGATPPKIIA